MDKNLYFRGHQIKNYLIGFASLFSEIPYMDRVGIIQTVPIHYGSPSDVISFLENNVDNDATTNRNRLKDITIPMFSFRMTALEKNNEKRRAPHDTLTVDLRPLGYNTGYVTMKPSPYKFTMELSCWASSDYQAFEITEQIIPYFNSPQQVVIEPLPRSPVSATEIFLDSVDIDTDPSSQKYGAVVNMTFSLTGYILTQPKIWSTNLQFELSMLDEKHDGIKLDDTDYSVGHEIRDLNVESKYIIPNNDTFNSVEGFILNTPSVLSEYGEKLDWYNILVENKRIDKNGVVVDTTEFTTEYKGKEKTFFIDTIQYVAEEIDDVRYIFKNKKLQTMSSSLKLIGWLKILDTMINDDSETINIYLKLLDLNLVNSGFNRSGAPMLNSEKLSVFGSARIDTEDVLDRMRVYLSAMQSMKIDKPLIKYKYGHLFDEPSVILFENTIPYEELPEKLQSHIEASYLTDNESLDRLEFLIKLDKDYNLEIVLESNVEGILILETDSGFSASEFSSSNNSVLTITANQYVMNKTFCITLKVDGKKTIIYGVCVLTSENLINVINSFDYSVLELESSYNMGINDGINVAEELDKDYYRLFVCDFLVDESFKSHDEYIVSTLIYNAIQHNLYDKEKMLSIVKKRFNLNYDDIVKKANTVIHFVEIIKKMVDIYENRLSPISENELISGQQTVSETSMYGDDEYLGLAQTIAHDNDGKPIYDINKDGFINKIDLDLLKANVDNPDDYDYELTNGVWHKRTTIKDITHDISEEILAEILLSLKTILYIEEKENFDEIYDYLFLLDKDLIVESYDLYPNNENFKKKYKEIKSLGYDINELDTNFLLIRLFVNATRCLLIKNAKFLLYKIPDMNKKSMRMLNTDIGLDIDKIVKGKFIELYLNNYRGSERMKREYEIRDLLDAPLGEYLDYIYGINLLINDISNKTNLFTECLVAETNWLDTTLPITKQKIDDKYK